MQEKNKQNTKKKSILVVAILILALAILSLTAGTFALFSDSASHTNHLQAGSLKIGLYRTNLEGTQLKEDGTLGNYSDDDRVDLTKSDAKMFNMTNICPLVSQTATVEITNLGTTAFTYSVTITDVDLGDKAMAQALAEQIQVTVTSGDQTQSFYLSEVTEEGKSISLGTMLVTDKAASFTVKAEFVSGEGNNAAMNGDVSFDLVVNAIQYAGND